MAGSSSPDGEGPHTVVHEILKSNLPLADKALPRVYEEVATTIVAGFETTASAMRLIVYHTFKDAEILRRLRAELTVATATSLGGFDIKTLDQLPYLTSVIMEGIRLSPAIGSRMARIAPDRDLFYGEWRIPAGTPVGMTAILMHTDEQLYPEPFRFNPDRWMDQEVRRKLEKTFAPFSRGTRMCAGMQ